MRRSTTLTDYSVTPRMSEDDVIGFESLWSIVFNNVNSEIQTVSSEILFMLFQVSIYS